MNAMLLVENEVDQALVAMDVDPLRLIDVSRQAVASGALPEDLLYRSQEISRLDQLEVKIRRNGGSLLGAETIQQLPDADVVLYANNTTQPTLLVVAQRGDARRRAFIVHDGQPDSKQMRAGIATAAGAGYDVVGQIHSASSLLGLYHAQLTKVSTARQDASGDGDAESADGSTPIDEFLSLAHDAYKRGASDIHLSAERGRGTVQFREDGDLHDYRDYTEDDLTRIMRAVFNTMHESGSTRADFDPKQLQNAVITHDFSDVRLRFRYSGLPLVSDSQVSGFDATLRIIPVGQALKYQNPGDLGYARQHLDILGRAFARTSGIILFTGVTGSGKSTSLAAFLSMLAAMQPNKKIRSVEDPIEYIIPGVKQHPVDSTTLNDVLSQILRSDPDRIMVGEIRDIETAKLAISATRTGHMVASTLHTDAAPTAYSRLAGMGVSPSDLSSSGLFSAIVYQGLLKALCPHCRIPADAWASSNPQDPVVERLHKPRFAGAGFKDVFFQNMVGCRHCKGGKIGRTVAAEVLRPTTSMMPAIARGDSTAIWQEWRSQINKSDPSDMTGRTAFEHALYKMSQGLVSPHDVESVFKWIDEPAWDGEA